MKLVGKKTDVMQIVIRTDASSSIGTGHLMRCLTLAQALRKNNAVVFFLCREYDSQMCDLIEENGFTVKRLPTLKMQFYGNDSVPAAVASHKVLWQDDASQSINAIDSMGIKPDWLIVDHYALDKYWESTLRSSVKNIIVIDDLADRAHDCDLLLDQNYYMNMESRYEGLVPHRCQMFLGPQYLLLRDEFENALQAQRSRDGSVKRILMFFGGSDASHETLKAIQALSGTRLEKITVDVVVGQANTDHEQIQTLCASMPSLNYHYHVNNIAELMANADLAIIAAGSTTWETCFLGVPTITVMTAQNQFEAISALGIEGVIWNLGWHYEVGSDDIAKAIEKACLSPELLVEMGIRARRLMGNFNGVNKLLTAIKNPDALIG